MMYPADIGPYSLQWLVDEGGGGSVYVALDRRLGRQVAIKLVAMPPGRRAREIVVAEAHILARLDHRNIVQIYDVVETRDHLALVMEYVPGIDLGTLAEEVDLEWSVSLHVGVELAGALAACHETGVVHRDLKPANVLLDYRGRVKLADFGIALLQERNTGGDSTLENAVPGSYLAMSPEHAAGTRLDARSDLYGLGLILHRLLAGSHPFGGAANELALLQQLVNSDPPPLVERRLDAPADLLMLVDELLSRDPRERPRSALVVRQRLLALQRELPSSERDSLQSLVAAHDRQRQSPDGPLEVPDNLASGARSHLQTARDWNPRSGRTGGWRGRFAPAALFCAMGLLGWLLFPLFAPGDRSVAIARPLVLGGQLSGAGVDARQLEQMLHSAVQRQRGVQVDHGKPSSDRLHAEVNCNAYLCGLLLRSERDGEFLSAYATLLPEAPLPAWQGQVRRGVASLYGE
jgi:serine/threonine protein kinase